MRQFFPCVGAPTGAQRDFLRRVGAPRGTGGGLGTLNRPETDGEGSVVRFWELCDPTLPQELYKLESAAEIGISIVENHFFLFCLQHYLTRNDKHER